MSDVATGCEHIYDFFGGVALCAKCKQPRPPKGGTPSASVWCKTCKIWVGDSDYAHPCFNVTINAALWRSLAASVIKVYTLRQEITGGDWQRLYQAIFALRRTLDEIVPPDKWGEYVKQED